MGGLFSSLNNSLSALRSIESALAVSQNNVSNASTPGYADQVALLNSQSFNLPAGLAGGVQFGGTQSTQNEYVDQAVRTQLSAQGYFKAQSSPLASIQSLFDVTGQTGLTGDLNNLFQSFSAWSATPNTTTAQAVLSQAQAVAQDFQAASASLSQTTGSVNQQISANVAQINTLAAAVQSANVAIQNSAAPDAGLDANLHASLQSLSQVADVTVSFASNGTATVLLGGQTPLVIGSQQIFDSSELRWFRQSAGCKYFGLQRPGHYVADLARKPGRPFSCPELHSAVDPRERNTAGLLKPIGPANRGPREYDSDVRPDAGRTAGSAAVHLQRGEPV